MAAFVARSDLTCFSSSHLFNTSLHPHLMVLIPSIHTSLLAFIIPYQHLKMPRFKLTDDRDFPSLSNNPQMAGTNQPSSMWNNSQPARHLGGPQRNPSASIPPPTQQDDPFSPGSRLSSSQNSFRYGSQASMGQPQQPQPTGGEEFPPLARNGEIGQERSANLASAMSNLSFAPQSAVASSSAQPGRSGNGLLNAVTAQARTAEARSPVGVYCYQGV